MDIIVLVKQVPDLVEELEIDESGKSLDKDYIRYLLSEFDEYAIEEAVLLKEKYGGKIKDTIPQINVVLVKVPVGKEKEFIEKISKEDIVEYAELNYKVRALQ